MTQTHDDTMGVDSNTIKTNRSVRTCLSNGKDVLLWMKMNLIENGIDHNVIKTFLTQFSKQCVTGVIIDKLTNDPELMNELKKKFKDDCY